MAASWESPAGVLTLPFALTDTTVITFSGALTGSVLVGDHLKGSVGRFRLEASFDGAVFPAGAGTIPRTLAMDVTVGSQAYPGSTSLGSDDLRVKQNKWQEAKGN